MKQKVLIVGTVPYNKKSTSRAFESYFHNWEKENLAQIFSNTKTPTKGHCGTLFQITDQRLVKRRLDSKVNTGKVFYDKDLKDEWLDNSIEVNSKLFSKLYKLGTKKSPLVYLLRKFVWNKKYWCTKELNQWLDEFNPECVFLSFSDDFFILEIALYVAQKYNIPIVSSIGDDYYFNSKLSISPLYYIYRYLYKRLVNQVFEWKGNCIYIGNKIRDKYNSHFGLNGKTVYLTSNMIRKDFKAIDKINPKIVYCGNIRLGRNKSLNDIGYALGQINPNYILNVYSNETDYKYYSIFNKNKNIKYHGSIPYSEVQKEMESSDIVVIVEGFKNSDIRITKYSVSTKIADSLASGTNILVYGSNECGAIEYMNKTEAAATCINKNELISTISKFIDDRDIQKIKYENAINISKKNHSLGKSTSVFESVIKSVV